MRASSFVPEGAGLGHAGELGAVAGFGGLLPLGRSGGTGRSLPGRTRIGWLRRATELVAAEVVGAALHVADAQLAEQGFEEGNVAEVELILQGLGAGGDDDALAGAQGGQQVGEGFAGSGSGLDDQVAALCESPLDGFGHLQVGRGGTHRAARIAPECRRARRTRAARAGRGLGFRWRPSGPGAHSIIVSRAGPAGGAERTRRVFRVMRLIRNRDSAGGGRRGTGQRFPPGCAANPSIG